jgi:hypothetical protein
MEPHCEGTCPSTFTFTSGPEYTPIANMSNIMDRGRISRFTNTTDGNWAAKIIKRGSDVAAWQGFQAKKEVRE